jgi:hypothetical protein
LKLVTPEIADFVKRESGGRSQLAVVQRIRKEAEDERRIKLADEIRFLSGIPDEWKSHFPSIVLSLISQKKVFYEMPGYQLPTLRRLVFSGAFKHKEALKWIDKILDFAFEMYDYEKLSVPNSYMNNMHTQRLYMRIKELEDKSEVFRKITRKKNITINGKDYLNILFIFELIRESGLLNKCKPPYASRWAHSDLHFSNILIDVDNDNFIFLDPRGYRYCDYCYDFGKLWHSVHGKYEFVAEYRFKLRDSKFMLNKNEIYYECEKIMAGLPKILMKYSKETEHETLMKTRFNEAVHFSSLVPFILDFDGVETRARVAYYTGTILLNEFYDLYH